MTSHPKEPKLPESLEVVAWRYTHKGSGADCASTWRWSSDWPGRDVHDEDQLVRLTDHESALKARDAEIERQRGDAERTARNREMWKGQCERQAEQLTAFRTKSPLEALPPGHLYRAINNLLCHIGIEGSIDSRHGFVEEAMDALHAIDGGVYLEQLARATEQCDQSDEINGRRAPDAAIDQARATGGEKENG